MSIARPEVFREGVKLARGNFVAPALAVKCSHVPEKTAGDFAARPAANTVRRSAALGGVVFFEPGQYADPLRYPFEQPFHGRSF